MSIYKLIECKSLFSENISNFIQTEYPPLAHVTGGGFLKDGLSIDEEK